MRIVNIKDMPKYNASVKDNVDSVSSENVVLKTVIIGRHGKIVNGVTTTLYAIYREYPHCIQHGTMNKVSPEGIWRCLTCGVGCFQTGE